MNNEMRLQKFLSQSGICSRRRAEELMLGGRVKVNGKVCKELGTKINPDKDKVEVDGKPVNAASSFIYLLVNKPASYITSLYDPEGRALVTDLLPKSMPRVWPVGRLDWDTEGLLIMTNDGKLTNLMTHPSHEVPKTYAVKVRGQIGERDEVLDRLRQGVEIEPGEVTNPAQVRVNYYNGNNTWLEMTITEGKNRQVRRMWDAVDFPVMKLRRISMGSMTIDGLPSGAYRTLTHAEVAELYGDLDEAMPELAKPSKREKKREHDELERNEKPRAQFSETIKRRISRSIAAKKEATEAPVKSRESVNPRTLNKSGNSKTGAEKFGSYKPVASDKEKVEKKPYDRKAHFQINPVTGEKVVRAKRGYRPVESVEGDRAAAARLAHKESVAQQKAQRAEKPVKPAAKRDETKRDYKSAKDLRPGQSAPKEGGYVPKERESTSRERGFKVGAPKDAQKSSDKPAYGKSAASGKSGSGKPSTGKPSSGKSAPRSAGKSSGRPSGKPSKK